MKKWEEKSGFEWEYESKLRHDKNVPLSMVNILAPLFERGFRLARYGYIMQSDRKYFAIVETFDRVWKRFYIEFKRKGDWFFPTEITEERLEDARYKFFTLQVSNMDECVSAIDERGWIK